ncbi:DUF4397 domain-containing protein [Chitinophagaceae bacterium MMS25-I14]
MKKLYVYLLAATAVFSAASCKKKDDSSPTTARMMFFNGALNTTTVDALIKNAKVAGATNINFLGKAGYVSVTAGSSLTLKYNVTSTSTTLDSTIQTLAVGSSYSTFIGGDAFNGPKLVFASDDLTAPSSTNAKVRFVHLSPSTLSESVYVGTAQIASAIAYKTVTPFMEVPSGTANVIIVDPADQPHQVTLSNQTFSAGKIYTIVLTGITTGTGSAALAGTIINNN